MSSQVTRMKQVPMSADLLTMPTSTTIVHLLEGTDVPNKLRTAEAAESLFVNSRGFSNSSSVSEG